MGVPTGYETSLAVYNRAVDPLFDLGDVIQKAREKRKWNQERLGEEAALYGPDGQPLDAKILPINKSTVSKVEREPYTSEHGTILRLLAALGMTWADVEKALRGGRDPAGSSPVKKGRTGSR